MVNEDIVTALRNAIDHGDSLESAKQIMINSGYNPREVEQASQFIAGGITPLQQPKPDEELIMPSEKKSFLHKLKFWDKKVPAQPVAIPAQPTTPLQPQPLQKQQVSPQQLKQEIISQQQVPRTIQQVNQQPQKPEKIQVPLHPSSTQKELKKIKPSKPGHIKEIILLIILLVLIGILIITIVMKDTILGWFSG